MLIESFIFYVFAAGLILSATGVIFLKNPVHGALSLVLAFVASSCLWLMLEAEFLALILILVYVGAVMTLFLFVVMTIDLDRDAHQPTFVRYFPFALILMAVFAGILIFIFSSHLFENHFVKHPEDFSNIQSLGEILYTQYAYPFELAAVLLLIAIVAAISLNPRTLKSKAHKTQIIENQIDIHRKDRIRLVKMSSEKKP
ncbi:MAG: hypothetical protein A2W47_01660 [Gammaproteobacteria bacterium RIFCSPHIGHO2_12_38_15]|nr:MAG: hypothetical protein A2W47_01660 [Gammaproteobacteria bacterium RIFCSPHIGHO2_12_38_15]